MLHAGSIYDLLLAEVRDDLDHRQEHRDDDEADDKAQQHNHHGFNRRGETGDGHLHLVLVEVGDFVEHVIQRARFLADADHVDDHRREHFAALERVGDFLTFADAGARFDNGVRDDRVAHDARDGLHRLQDGHARREQGAHRAAEARHHDFVVQRSEHGHAQFDPVSDAPSDARTHEQLVGNQNRDHRDNHHIPALREQRAEVNQELRRRGHLLDAQLLEQAGELRHEPRDQEDYDADRRQQHDDGVGQRRADFAAQFHIFFEEACDALQRLFQHAADLARANQTDNQLAERFRVARHRAGEALARFDARGQVHQNLAQAGVVGLRLQHIQTANQRHARIQHRGELAGEDGEVAEFDTPVAACGHARRLAILGHFQHLQSFRLQAFLQLFGVRRFDLA
jgi:hypothetical protein